MGASSVAITDVQISQKARAGVTGQRDLQVDASQGIGGSETTTFSEVTDEKRYRTRVMSTAYKVNLKCEESGTRAQCRTDACTCRVVLSRA